MNKNSNFIQTFSTKIDIKKFYDCKTENYKVSNECFISVLFISNENIINNVLITCDIIWFSSQCVKKVRSIISKNLNIPTEGIILAASHTHGTPNPESSISHPPVSKDFDDYITKKILQSFYKTKASKKKQVKIEFRRTLADNFSVNRRRSALSFNDGIKYKMQNLPNLKKPVDNNIDIVDFINIKTKKILATIIKVNCHPVSSPRGVIGSDYIGYLRNKLYNRTPNLYFLQGLCGDIRPKVIKRNKSLKDYCISLLIGKRFRKPNIFDSENISNKISDHVYKCSKQKPNAKLNYFGKSLKKDCSLKLKSGNAFKKKLEITIWNWNKIIFIFFNGEILSGYNIFNYKQSIVICVGYCNGMIGYIPTKEDIIKGGYEVNKSRINFKINEKLSEKNEAYINNQIENLLKKV